MDPTKNNQIQIRGTDESGWKKSNTISLKKSAFMNFKVTIIQHKEQMLNGKGSIQVKYLRELSKCVRKTVRTYVARERKGRKLEIDNWESAIQVPRQTNT